MDKVQLVAALSSKNEKHLMLIIEDDLLKPPQYYGFATWAPAQKLDYFDTPQELFMQFIKELPKVKKPFGDIRYAGDIFIDPNEIKKHLE